MLDDVVNHNGPGLFDDRPWVEHFGGPNTQIALVAESPDEWPDIAMSGALLAELKAIRVKGVAAYTNQLEAQCLFSRRGEPTLAPEAADRAPAAKAKKTKQDPAKAELSKALDSLKKIPWDCQKDGFVYFQLSSPEFVVLDPMTGEDDSTYTVKQFKGPGLYRLPVAAIKRAKDASRGVAVDSASLLFIDNEFLADLGDAYSWDDSTTKNGDYDLKYHDQLARRLGIRFGICSTPPKKFKSQFIGDGFYTIDASKVELVKGR